MQGENGSGCVTLVAPSAIGLEMGSAVQDYIGLYGGDAKLLGESLEYVHRSATQIHNAIGADSHS